MTFRRGEIVPFRRPRRRLPRPDLRIWVVLGLAALAVLHLKPIRTARELAGLAPPSCRILSFADGDTVTARCPGRWPETVRLTGFDTPEFGQAECPRERLLALAATLRLAALVFAADEATFRFFGRDRHGRRLGALFLDGEISADLMTGASLARGYDGGRRMSWRTPGQPRRL